VPPKASVEEIRARFDNDVERFSNLDTGQMSTQDAALVLDLISAAARRLTPNATRLLDLGCGAGNFSLKLAQVFSFELVTLVDLSAPMLERASARLSAAGVPSHPIQSDIRDIQLPPASQDLIVAAAVLHHLRDAHEWAAVFANLFQALRPGGALLIWDLVAHDIPALQDEMWFRYGEYLAALRGDAYRDHVLAYVAYEDSPRSVPFQLQQLTAAGFTADVIHKNGCFAALAAHKPGLAFRGGALAAG
jgi:tRNA (cmo5U34)-methyltransferase